MTRKRRGRGEGTVYLRSDGRWCGQVTVGYDPATRKQERRVVYGRTQEEVVAAIQRIRSSPPSASSLTLIDYLHRWLDAQRDQLSPGSISVYTTQIGHLCRVAAGLRLDTLSALQVSRLPRSLVSLGVPIAQRYLCAQRLRQALRRAFELDLIPRPVDHLIELPRISRTDPQPLDAEQVGRLLATARSTPHHALLWTALDTGARKAELAALGPADYDWTSGRLSILRQCRLRKGGGFEVAELKTKASRRVLLLGLGCCQALAAAPRDRWLFPTMNREAMGHKLPWWDAILAEAGLPSIRFHDLRHTTATLLLQAGIGVHEVAQRLGHSTPALVLRTYGHVLAGMAMRASRAIDEVLRSSQRSSLPVGLRELPEP